MNKVILTTAALLSMVSSAFAQIGSLSSDLVFTPITPCRIFDTRLIGPTPGTPIRGDATYVFFAGGVSSFASAGGSATNCGLQTAGLNIAAVAVNFVAVGPAAAGYITVYPNGGVQPTASTLNYTAGEVVANSAIVKVSQTSITAMNIYTLATTHLLADVTGYYSAPVATGLECVTVSSGMTAIAAGGTANAFSPACTAGYSYTATECRAGTYDVFYAVQEAGLCAAKNTGAATTIIARSRCCRIPGR